MIGQDSGNLLLESARAFNGMRFTINLMWAIVVLTIFCAGRPDLIDGMVTWLSK